MLTTSEYLYIQSQLLITRAAFRRLDLSGFAAKLDEVVRSGGVLTDHTGKEVVTDLVLMRRLVLAADALSQILIDGEIPRKPIVSESHTTPHIGYSDLSVLR
jgi:hypothetical protein